MVYVDLSTDDSAIDDENTSSTPFQTSFFSSEDHSPPSLGSPLSDITDQVRPINVGNATFPRGRIPTPIRSRRSYNSAFEIHTDPPAVQQAALMSMQAPIPYPHDDQENNDIMPDEAGQDEYGSIVVQTMEEFEASEARNNHHSDMPSMFDGGMDHIEHIAEDLELPHQIPDENLVAGADVPETTTAGTFHRGVNTQPGLRM